MPPAKQETDRRDRIRQVADLAREARAAELAALIDKLRAEDAAISLDDRLLLGTLLALAHANAQDYEGAQAALDAVLPLVPAARPVRQAGFNAMSGWAAHGLGDDEAALDAVVRALALVDGDAPHSTDDVRAVLGKCSLVLALLQLFPLAADVAERSISVACVVDGPPVSWLEFQVGFVYYGWAIRLDHLGLAEQSEFPWSAAKEHFSNALAAGELSVLFRAWALAWRAVCSARLGQAEQGRRDLDAAGALPVRPPNPGVQRSLAHAEGALLLAEGQLVAAERILLPLWESLGASEESPFIEEIAALLGRAAAARGDGRAALRWFREMHQRYGRAQYQVWLSRATAARLQIEQDALLRRTRELELDALSDPLTGVPNRRAFDANLPRLVAAAHAIGTPLTLAIVDVDRFKRVNDTFGHPVGDEVLRRVARILQDHSRDADRCARYGGDELTLCLPVAAPEAAVAMDRIKRMITDQEWSGVAPDLAVTVSVGLAGLRPGDSCAALLRAADRSLLAAKRARPPAAEFDGVAASPRLRA
jgi:diguanylate cyclase (GGDEF)-like protein